MLATRFLRSVALAGILAGAIVLGGATAAQAAAPSTERGTAPSAALSTGGYTDWDHHKNYTDWGYGNDRPRWEGHYYQRNGWHDGDRYRWHRSDYRWWNDRSDYWCSCHEKAS